MTTTWQGQGRKSLAITSCACLLLCIATVGMVNKAALVKADHASPPKHHELFFFVAGNHVVVASPSGSKNESEFGTIIAFNTIARESSDDNSPVVGQGVGQVIISKDGSQFITFMYLLNLSDYDGSLAGQGVEDPLGSGDLVIVDRTGNFLYTTGHAQVVTITKGILLKSTVSLKYDESN